MARTKSTPADATPPPAADYTVLARRYRPQQFTDLIGQEHVARALVNALKSNRVAHAYLFTGARGVGKTSTARILAKALNCERGPTPTPCDECPACRGIATGEDVDVLEIDAASNRGIDEVRAIRGNVQYRPSRSRFKVYIIDEVHMLTPAAFNALLKTLEEPPAHIKFVFATTEAQKIPITILSRCQRFDFSGIGTVQIVGHLREVVAAEGLQADDEALELVARRAGGSMRDAQSLLDQLLAFGGDRLTADAVHGLLGTAGDERVLELASAVLRRDAREALVLVGRMADEGLQLGELVDGLIGYWRDLMILHCGEGHGEVLSVSPRHREALATQATAAKLDTLLAGLDVLSSTRLRMARSGHGRTLLEMALVRLARLDELLPVSQLVNLVASGSAAPVPAPSPAPRPSAPSPARSQAVAEPVKKKSPDVETASPASYVPFTPESATTAWAQVLEAQGPMLRAEADKAGPPAIIGPNALALRFAAGYNHSREYCQKNLERLELALRKVAGADCQLRVELAGGDAEVSPLPAAPAATPTTRQRRPRSEVPESPLLQRAIELLEAQLVHADEGFGAAPAPVERAEVVDDEES